MTEWWTYRLSSFLMFSPEVYWRLVERFNEAWWPAQVLACAGGLGLTWLLRAGSAARLRAALLLLALAWAWVAWAFAWRRYAEIFLGAPWMAGAYGVQAVLLAAAACWPARSPSHRAPAGIAWVLLALALLYPLLAPLTGHPLRQAEVTGFMPDPTAFATLAVLAALREWPRLARIGLAVIPLLSLLLGAATRWLLAQ